MGTIKSILLLIIVLLFLIGCSFNNEKMLNQNMSKIANPASVNCIENNGELEIRTSEDGSQYGVCVFSDDSECEEWAFFKGKCLSGVKNEE